MARTRDIRTNQVDIACDVCGRTLLRGERAEPFLAGGERRQVCELCTVRAEHEGWIRESGADELTARAPRHDGRRRSLLDRLRGKPRSGAAWPAPEIEEPPPFAEDGEPATPAPEPPPAQEPQPARPARPRGGAPAAPPKPRRRTAPREPRHVRAVPTNADLKMQRALEVFNGSDYTRTVGGVSRSLGPPGVSVRPLPEAPAVVTITVMWELSWYRFVVDLSDEAGGVRRDAQGSELDELPPDDQVVNAAADERGALHLAADA